MAIATIVILLCQVCAWFCVYMLLRNEKVHAFRLRMIYSAKTLEDLKKLEDVSYMEMMRKFWVWPLDRFYK